VKYDYGSLITFCVPGSTMATNVVVVVFLPAILLRSIKVPYPELRRRIVEVDEEKLNVEQLEQLIRCMPEPKQMKDLAGFKKEYSSMTEAEQFCVDVRKALLLHSLLT